MNQMFPLWYTQSTILPALSVEEESHRGDVRPSPQKETDSSYPSNHQMPIAPPVGAGPHELSPHPV